MRRSLEEIANEYVILDCDHDSWGESFRPELRNHLWDLKQEMEGRVGDEHTVTHIKRAEETLKLMGVKRKNTLIKWYVGLALTPSGLVNLKLED